MVYTTAVTMTIIVLVWGGPEGTIDIMGHLVMWGQWDHRDPPIISLILDTSYNLLSIITTLHYYIVLYSLLCIIDVIIPSEYLRLDITVSVEIQK